MTQHYLVLDNGGMDADRLARAVKEARGARTQPDVVNRASARGHQISVQSLRNIEQARHETYWASTLLALDAGLGWEPGTAQAILEGKEQPSPDSTLAARIARLEARLRGATSEIGEITAMDAMTVVLSRLDDDQYACVAQAVSTDPRFQYIKP